MRARQLRSVRFVALALCLLAWSLAPGTASAAYPAAGDQGVVFSYQNASAGAVFLAGDFNGWNAADLALSKDSDGVWTVAVPLEPGTYEYKFVVDGNWLEDPDNPQTKSDPFGGSNSLITIADDGSVVAAGTTAPKTKPSGQTGGSGGLPDDVTLGRPVNVDGGILFTYDGANANSVYLAGSFNDWNAQALPLSLTDGNVWAVVTELPEGANTYKFVVDGNWFADPENPETEADPYGGVNSLVNVDAAGEVVEGAAAPADEKPMSNTALNAKIYIGGRYITRMEWAKNVLDDPRYRLQRPAQSVDLNFETTVSDLVSTYMRMRLDSDQNIIQNNVAAFLDEANLQITPDNFNLKAYWNQEVFTSDDLIHLAGDVDLPGTIGHDHLNLGKGTAGAVFNAEPFGVTFRSLFANTYNDDYYNDPDLYDNTGRDIMAVRLSRRFGSFEVGLPAVLNRSQIWMGFEELVGAASTGIPAFDEYLAESGDDSKRFETENHNYNVGLDLRYGLPDENLELGAEVIFVDDLERIVTGEDSGPNQVNGAIDVPFLERQSTRVCGQIKWEPSETSWLRLRHIYTDQTGATADQRHMELTYQDQSTANKNIYFEIQDSPALTDEQYTDLEGAWSRDDLDLKFWIYRKGWCRDYGINNQTVPRRHDAHAERPEPVLRLRLGQQGQEQRQVRPRRTGIRPDVRRPRRRRRADPQLRADRPLRARSEPHPGGHRRRAFHPLQRREPRCGHR